MTPHGIPTDLMDRLVIVRTLPYAIQDIMQIISIRAKTEGITIDDDALAFLSQIGSNTSLRYALQLLSPASIIASTVGRDTITRADIEEVSDLFFDAKASSKLLLQDADKYVTH